MDGLIVVSIHPSIYLCNSDVRDSIKYLHSTYVDDIVAMTTTKEGKKKRNWSNVAFLYNESKLTINGNKSQVNLAADTLMLKRFSCSVMVRRDVFSVSVCEVWFTTRFHQSCWTESLLCFISLRFAVISFYLYFYCICSADREVLLHCLFFSILVNILFY